MTVLFFPLFISFYPSVILNWFTGELLKSEFLTHLNTESACFIKVEPRFNEPLYNEVLGKTNDSLQPGKNYSKMYGAAESRFNEILVITNTIQKRNRKLYLVITSKCQHLKKRWKPHRTNKDKIYVHSSFKQFCLPVLEFLSSAVAISVQLNTEELQ